VTDPNDRPQYSVCQFLVDGTHEYIKRWITAREAVEIAQSYTMPSRPGVKLGIIRRVIITDSGDYINWEWQHGVGVTFPKDH